MVLPPRRPCLYLTQGVHNGAQAPGACAAGFHIPSVFELLPPTAVEYDTTLGVSFPNQGDGIPALPHLATETNDDPIGWMSNGRPGGNCNSFTSGSVNEQGSIMWLNSLVVTPIGTVGQVNPVSIPVDPWEGRFRPCSNLWRVWCLEDR